MVPLLQPADNPDACRKMLDSLLENWWCRSALLQLSTKFLNGVNRFSKIAEVVNFVLTLSHGQAAVERGFSISEETLFENPGNDIQLPENFFPA